MIVKFVGGPLDGATADMEMEEAGPLQKEGPLVFGGLTYHLVVQEGTAKYQEGYSSVEILQFLRENE